jgi:short-subunit dehydrogenase
MARGLAGAGAGLMIVGRDQMKNANAFKELSSTLGVTAVSVAADLASRTGWRRPHRFLKR